MSDPRASGLDIRVLSTPPATDWNNYVNAHPCGNFFHLGEWAAVYAELSWLELCYLEARRAGELVGIMPLALVRFGLKGRAMVSAPYCVEAGALAADPEAQAMLEDYALTLAHERDADFLELRQTVPRAQPGWPVTSEFCGFSRALAGDIESNLAAIPRKQRAMVRKGEAAGLIAAGGMAINDFYQLYARSVRNLGTPVYSLRFFAALSRHLAPYINILRIDYDGRVIAAVLSFYYRGAVMPYYVGALPIARTLKAYDFMYWQLMRDACMRGCTSFDFGRSLRDSGAYAFKKNWGFTPRLLQYHLLPVRAAGASTLDPDSPFNRYARRAWSHLPLPIANLLGPFIARRLY